MTGHQTVAAWLTALACIGGVPAQPVSDTTDSRAAALRTLPARANRHALIIGIGRYADPATPILPGVKIDRQSATQMAQAMQVPLGQIRYLQDEQATGNAIRQAIRDLTDTVADGDRVFIHFSGHGTRYFDAGAGGCVEALLAHDGGSSGTITNTEMAGLLKSLTRKTDKLFVMYDACHSGGVVKSAVATRDRRLGNPKDEGVLRPKFSNTSQECSRPVNVRTRGLLPQIMSNGALPQDIVHISAARDDEISFDDELKGGLATQFMRDCMLREARDTDNSGAVSIDEIRQCAQTRIDRRMVNDATYKPHHLVLNGNAGFVPSWFSLANPGEPAAASGAATPAPVNVSAAAPAPTPDLTGAAALRQIFDQRDAKRRVQIVLARDRLRIGQDALDFSVQSDRAGYVYVAMAGSDNRSLELLFPNALDRDNRIAAGQQLLLPRPSWRVTAGGPAGIDQLLVIVTDGPRDHGQLSTGNAAPFLSSLNDAAGRAKLGILLTQSESASQPGCVDPGNRQSDPACSDAYGAAMLTVEETP